MSTLRKIRANRANAKRSTGPKTRAGKTRAAQNAHRHGLSVPLSADLGFAPEVDALANEMAAPAASSRQAAWYVAEALIDLKRIRQARQAFLVRAIENVDGRPNRRSAGVGSNLAAIFPESARALIAFDRYERRALSRRKFAIRNLDALSNGVPQDRKTDCRKGPR